MFEAITLGFMLHSHHFDAVEASAQASRYSAKTFTNWCEKYRKCVEPVVPDSGDEFKYNDSTPGIYVIADGWTAALFRNSYSKPSVFGGYTFQKDTKYGIFGATVGAVTGYQYEDHSWVKDQVRYEYRSGFTNAKLLPTAMVSYATPKLFNTDARVRLMYTPKKNVLTVGVEKQF